MNPPERWTTRFSPYETDADDEARAGRLLRRAIVKQPLDAGALADIHARLPDERRPSRRPLTLSIAVALSLFLSGGAVVMSATLLGHWSSFRLAPVEVQPPATVATAHRARVTPARAITLDEERVDVAAPAASVSAARLARRAAAPADVEPLTPVVAPTPTEEIVRPSTMAREAALLGAALRRLRDEGDAAGALVVLDAHDAEFAATGALADEASTTRVEALLRLGRHAEALALLDAQTLRATGRGRDLLASRGELRADAGRGPEAFADFDAVLADDATADVAAERALYGRAACRARGGDADAARADLTTYLARFPGGRFVSRARLALDR